MMKNFGKIINTFNEILTEGIISKNNSNKHIFKNYIKNIKENEILRTQFLVYDNIENKAEKNEFKANLFLQENINLLNKYSSKEILEANKKLMENIHIKQPKVSYENESLHEDITKLIFLKKETKNIDSIVEATANILNYIKNNKIKVINESEHSQNDIIFNMIESNYSDLDQTEKQVIKTLIESTDNQKQETYQLILKECIDIVNDKLKESDQQTKDMLLQSKDILLNKKQTLSENIIDDISFLINFRRELKQT